MAVKRVIKKKVAPVGIPCRTPVNCQHLCCKRNNIDNSSFIQIGCRFYAHNFGHVDLDNLWMKHRLIPIKCIGRNLSFTENKYYKEKQ